LIFSENDRHRPDWGRNSPGIDGTAIAVTTPEGTDFVTEVLAEKAAADGSGLIAVRSAIYRQPSSSLKSKE
jgi:hypothetical protein